MAEMTEAEKRKATQDSFNKKLVTTAEQDPKPEDKPKEKEGPSMASRIIMWGRKTVADNVPGKGYTDQEKVELLKKGPKK